MCNGNILVVPTKKNEHAAEHGPDSYFVLLKDNGKINYNLKRQG